jgi:hypothetical protein
MPVNEIAQHTRQETHAVSVARSLALGTLRRWLCLVAVVVAVLAVPLRATRLDL